MPAPAPFSPAPESAHTEASPSAVLVARNLVRRFGGRVAVNGVSLHLEAGACLALFGPNGAGKTTLLRMLGGLLKPSAGEVSLVGTRLPGGGATRRLVGLISHHTMLYAPLTARENVRFAAECQGVIDADGAATRALARLRVLDRAEAPVRSLSRGLQQRVSIARALVHGPQLVLLDEPYTGLDDVGARALTAALQEAQAEGATLVLVTHHVHEGLALATDAAIMLDGRLAHREQATTRGIDVVEYQERYRALVSEGVA
jgi:heme exporter protein A